jgi:hypothetical protein
LSPFPLRKGAPFALPVQLPGTRSTNIPIANRLLAQSPGFLRVIHFQFAIPEHHKICWNPLSLLHCLLRPFAVTLPCTVYKTRINHSCSCLVPSPSLVLYPWRQRPFQVLVPPLTPSSIHL